MFKRWWLKVVAKCLCENDEKWQRKFWRETGEIALQNFELTPNNKHFLSLQHYCLLLFCLPFLSILHKIIFVTSKYVLFYRRLHIPVVFCYIFIIPKRCTCAFIWWYTRTLSIDWHEFIIIRDSIGISIIILRRLWIGDLSED